MAGPSSSPRGEYVGKPGTKWPAGERYVDNDPHDTFGRDDALPAPANRAARRAAARAARRNR